MTTDIQVQDGDFQILNIEEISPDPSQPRKYFKQEALEELSSSIRQKGVLQPIIIRKDESGKYWLVAGERRFKASQLAGLTQIPTIITTGDPAEIALIENIQRENLNPIEEAEGYALIIKKHGYTQEDLAKIVGKSRSSISETLMLNKLTQNIKNICRTSDIPKYILLEVAKQPTEKDQEQLFVYAKDEKATVASIRELSKQQYINKSKIEMEDDTASADIHEVRYDDGDEDGESEIENCVEEEDYDRAEVHVSHRTYLDEDVRGSGSEPDEPEEDNSYLPPGSSSSSSFSSPDEKEAGPPGRPSGKKNSSPGSIAILKLHGLTKTISRIKNRPMNKREEKEFKEEFTNFKNMIKEVFPDLEK